MRARFQAHVDGRILQETFVLDGADGIHFGMRLATSDVITFADDGVLMYDDGSYHRVGGCIALPVLGQLDASGDIFFVFCHCDS